MTNFALCNLKSNRMKTTNRYQGVVVPMVTPVTQDGRIDTAAVARIVDRLASHQVAPLLMGTTGEGNSVSQRQGVELIAAAASAAQGRVTLYAGLPGCCVSEQLESARLFVEAGADVIAATLPSYYALTPEQMYAYYEGMADRLPVPLMLYNIDKTTHMSIPLDVIERLSHHPNIAGLKDSENNVPRLQEALALFGGHEGFSYFCGCAANSTVALCHGADGIVPSIGNYAPQAFQALFEAAVSGEVERAQQLQQLTNDLAKANTQGLTLGQSLAGLKLIMHEHGLCDPYMLPPLTRLAPETEALVLEKYHATCARYADQLSALQG